MMNNMNNSRQVSVVNDVSVHRFVLPDMDKAGSWLIARLQQKYPHLTDRGVSSWFRGIIESSEYLFIRRNRAVLLAQAIRDPLSPHPVVREIFCLAQDGGADEAATLYGDLRRWADNLDASEIIVEQFSDVGKAQIAEALGGKVSSRPTSVMRLAK